MKIYDSLIKDFASPIFFTMFAVNSGLE